MKRIEASRNQVARDRWLPKLVSGEYFGTVGISHLTTSRQHLQKPVLHAVADGHGGYVLNGYSPWVTGGAYADIIVMGATLDDGRQLLAAVPGNAPGLQAGPGASLIALSASCTDAVSLNDVVITEADVLAGPVHNVMQHGSGAGTGGLQTSTLAVGLSQGAIRYLIEQPQLRADLQPIAEKLHEEAQQLEADLLELAGGHSACTQQQIRQRANSLALRSTAASLTAAKGAGFIEGHPVGRWCREALFFLVWSCPQNVLNANLCEFAGLGHIDSTQ
jgi:alkylation response protein AidB-like acyl-CoA dehydrogenase